MVPRSSYCGHRVPVDLVAEDTGLEVPKFDFTVQAAADDCLVKAIHHDACDVSGVFAFPRIEFSKPVRRYFGPIGCVDLYDFQFSCLNWRERRWKPLAVYARLQIEHIDATAS